MIKVKHRRYSTFNVTTLFGSDEDLPFVKKKMKKVVLPVFFISLLLARMSSRLSSTESHVISI